MSDFITKVKQFDLDQISFKQFSIIILVIFLFGASIRFWELDRFNELVFDEVYFPKFAYDYLNKDRFFHVHPPLGKLTQAAGIWIYNNLPWVDDPNIGTVELQKLNAHSWRWVNALFGSLLCLLVAGTVYLLTKNRLFTVFAALFVVLDGSLIVASRYGLSNVQIVFFGFLSMFFLIKALTATEKHRRWLIISGILLGCTFSIKWNGLGYSLISWCVFIGATLCMMGEREINKIEVFKKAEAAPPPANKKKNKNKKRDEQVETPPKEVSIATANFNIFSRIKLYEYFGYLFVIPFVVYSLFWIPDLNLNSRHAEYGFIGMQKQIRGYHSNTIGADVHPYCSRWYTWPLMQRPISYYFKKKPVVKDGKSVNIVRDVHLFGNPFLYWMGIAALLWIITKWMFTLLVWIRMGVVTATLPVYSIISLGFLSNFLPWVIVSRCTFFYHYQSASVFKFLALAWVTAELLKGKAIWQKALGSAIVLTVVAGFIYWIPVQLGLPIESPSYYSRMWFRSWI